MTTSAASSFRATRTQIRSLDDDSLLSSIQALVARERRLEIHVLLHLSEMARRKLHLDLGFRSMFDYCILALGYSRSGAGRRLQAAGCLTRFPRVARLVEGGELTITTVCLIASVLDKKNESELLEQVRGCTQEQVERILVSFGRKVVVKERVTRVRSNGDAEGEARTASAESSDRPEANSGVCSEPASPPSPASPSPQVQSQSDESEGPGSSVMNESNADAGVDQPASNGSESEGLVQNGAESSESAPDGPAPTGSEPRFGSAESPIPTEEFKLTLVVRGDFMAKLKRAQALCSGGAPRGAKIIETVEAALDQYLEKNCPIERHKRREQREQRKQFVKQDEVRTADAPGVASPASPANPANTTGPEPTTLPRRTAQPKATTETAPPNRKPIPQATRDAVLARDGARCTYVGRKGRRCNSLLHVEVDHRLPRALGGGDSLDNLRTLCRAHNQREADRILGEEFMERRRRHRVPVWDSAAGPGEG